MSDKNYKQPFYGVDLEVLDVGVEVRVNDIPIYRDEQRGQLKVELPAPDAIINGTNTLSIQAILPYLDQRGAERSEVFEPTANIRATLFVQELNGTEKEISTALELATPAQLSALKKSDEAFKIQMKELEIDVEKIHADDRDSARKRQMALGDHTPTVLAILTISNLS